MNPQEPEVTQVSFNGAHLGNAESVTFERTDPATGETQTVLRMSPGPLQVPSRRHSRMLMILGAQAASMQQQAEPPRLPRYGRKHNPEGFVFAQSAIVDGQVVVEASPRGSLLARRKLLAEKRWNRKRR